MAERNPVVPSERRKDMESRSSADQRESTHAYAQEQAELAERQRQFGVRQILDAREEEEDAAL